MLHVLHCGMIGVLAAWDVLSMDMDMDILAWDTLDSLAAPITSRQAQRHPPRNKFSVIKFSVIKFSVMLNPCI